MPSPSACSLRAALLLLISGLPAGASPALTASAPGPQEAAQAAIAPRLLTLEDVLSGAGQAGALPRVRFEADGSVRVSKGSEQQRLDLERGVLVSLAADEAGAAAPAGEVPADPDAEPARPWRVREGRLEVARAGDQGRVRYLPLDVPAGEVAEVAADSAGQRLAFVLGGDLWVAGLAAGEAPKNLSGDGEPELLDGILDWVYQEELYGRGDFRGYWWAPDGSAICWLRLDEQAVPSFTVVDHVPPGARETNRGVLVETTRYPKVGEPNPTASLAVYRFADQTVRWFDLESFPQDRLIVRVDWAPDSSAVWFSVQDRIQTGATLCVGDPATGAVRRLIEETSPTWVNRPESPRFLADGGFLWFSERSGYNHLYRYAADGSGCRALTEGEWQVRSLLRLDEAAGCLWFEGTRDGAIDRHVYRVSLEGGAPERITLEAGSHELEFSPDGRLAIDTWSALDQPPRRRLIEGATGKTVFDFGQADRGQAPALSMVDPLRLSIPARDGLALDGTLLLPPGHGSDPALRYPIFLDTYSGPDAPTVANRYRPSAWLQFLAQRGCLVLQVNVRTASGRGQAFTGLVYRRFLELELADLEAAVAFVLERYQGDPSRVALSGWSYGGSITAYALTHSKTFSLGFAGAGVYDWRLYDSIYTERYMQTPDLNPDGYRQSSVIEAAKELSGHLVLLHGTIDDNVHLQNTIQLVDELQKAGKQNFELMLYPNARHGVSSKHRLPYMWGVLRREFGLPAAPAAAPAPAEAPLDGR
jgi:dipeptidyl-peptidase-4